MDFRFSIVVLVCTASACLGRAPANQVAPDAAVTVKVQNQNFYDANIYIADANCSRVASYRALRVGGNSKQVFHLRASEFGASSFSFRVHLVGESGSYCSYPSGMTATAGSIVEFTVVPNPIPPLIAPAVYAPR